MAESSINMKFTAQTADAQKRIADLEKEVARLNQETKNTKGSSEQASTGLGGLSSSATSAAAAIATTAAALVAVVSASKACIEAYRKQELAEARLSAVLKATDNQIGMTVDELKDLASATQAITRFGDEAVIEAEKVLIATQALDKEGLQRAIATSADLAEAMGTDIVSAAQTMAFALQDPEQGLTRLRRQGIAFTDEEIAQVKALQDANDLYGAQALVLEKVESRYKGVATAVAQTSSGKLDQIKNVWGDIKEGLGQGLLDSISPALESLYSWLQKISGWVADVADLNSVSAALKTGGSLAGFPTPLLERALREYNSAYNSSNPEFRGRTAYLDWQDAINTELALRSQQQIISPTVIGGGASGSGESAAVTTATSAIMEFLNKYGSGSVSYKAQGYQNIIDQAESLRAQMRFENGKYNQTTRENWGIDTLDEFVNMYNQLGEIIDDAQAKKDKLYEVPESAVRSMKDFITDYTGLSKTAQVSAIDMAIAEAEQWEATAEAGSEELTIIEEIIAGLKEQKKALEEVAKTDGDTTKEIKDNWSAVASYVSGAISATASYFTQMWDQQADELEKILERDKKAGDMSEEEEAERLQTINDLRRKSFNAEKANSITSALINGALAVTKCLSELGPVAGPIAASLVAATTGLQVATIASQQFTPMAKGGIVTEATPIVAGEAGPEAIIPLSNGGAQKYLGNGGVTINITIEGNADEDAIFHAIERAQRTGYLPNWQYV